MANVTQDHSRAIRLLILLFSIGGYVLFLGVFIVFIGWSVGLIPALSLDGPPLWFNTGSALAAIAVNLGLIVVFGVQHSTMARQCVKVRMQRIIPKAALRATFVWLSSLLLVLTMVAWQPLPIALWHAEGMAYHIILAANLAGWLMVVASTYMVDHFEFVGLRQAWEHLRWKSPTPPAFVSRYAYRFVRHPMMTGLLVGLWVVPVMSWGHLTLSAGLTAYILIGTHFEEGDLAKQFGDQYRRYQQYVPMLIPRPGASMPGIQKQAASEKSMRKEQHSNAR